MDFSNRRSKEEINFFWRLSVFQEKKYHTLLYLIYFRSELVREWFSFSRGCSAASKGSRGGGGENILITEALLWSSLSCVFAVIVITSFRGQLVSIATGSRSANATVESRQGVPYNW